MLKTALYVSNGSLALRFEEALRKGTQYRWVNRGTEEAWTIQGPAACEGGMRSLPAIWCCMNIYSTSPVNETENGEAGCP